MSDDLVCRRNQRRTCLGIFRQAAVELDIEDITGSAPFRGIVVIRSTPDQVLKWFGTSIVGGFDDVVIREEQGMIDPWRLSR
jgi:hypothetical protein